MTATPAVRALLLAAGLGTRLRPLTDTWPKCLMPIGERPLLEYWLAALHQAGIRQVLVNLHYFADEVDRFLRRPCFADWVTSVYEPELLGTAATLTANADFFRGHTTLLVHADNWCQCDFSAFLHFHQQQRPDHCPTTMMTFDTDTPQSCGIVELDDEGVVVRFHEKVANPPGRRANAAVYLLEPEVLEWLLQHPEVSDFSTQVLPQFVGRIATWHNTGILRDIGSIPALQAAQSDPRPQPYWPQTDAWLSEFNQHPIHRTVRAIASSSATETSL